jgi:hypothetical protein
MLPNMKRDTIMKKAKTNNAQPLKTFFTVPTFFLSHMSSPIYRTNFDYYHPKVAKQME